MSKEDYNNKVINISPLIYARKHQVCSCKDRIYEVDATNRIITCSKCGQVIEPFDVVLDLLEGNKKYGKYLIERKQVATNIEKWFKKNKVLLTVRKFFEEVERGCMPICPHCKEVIDIEKIVGWEIMK